LPDILDAVLHKGIAVFSALVKSYQTKKIALGGSLT